MAYVRTYDTKQRRNGKPVKRYGANWDELLRDGFGVPIPVNPANPDGPKKMRSREKRFATREAAQNHLDRVTVARHTTGGSLADQEKAGELPFGQYARAWLESLATRVQLGTLKQRTCDDSESVLRRYVLDRFGAKAIASISPMDAEQYLAALVRQPSKQRDHKPLAPATVTHAWNTFRAVMRYALRHKAILYNPCDSVDFAARRAVGDKSSFEHHPLTARQVSDLSAAITDDGYPVYGLMVTFLAYTGLRASENAGLEIRDLVFAPGPRCSVQVRRTKQRRKIEDGSIQWVGSTPKSKRSRRSVRLPPWLVEPMADYLTAHPRADDPTAPLWPSRKNGGSYRPSGERYVVPHDWSQPLAMGTFYETIFKPALVTAGLPASRPASTAEDGTPIAAANGVRLHDLRHSFAVMQLMAGEPFMKVADMMGHSTRTLVLDTYGDWIPEDEGGTANNLPEPPAPVQPVAAESNVVLLSARKLG